MACVPRKISHVSILPESVTSPQSQPQKRADTLIVLYCIISSIIQSPIGCVAMMLKVVQSSRNLTGHAGLAAVGHCLNHFARLPAAIDPTLLVRAGIVNSDVARAYVGLLALGKSDFRSGRELSPGWLLPARPGSARGAVGGDAAAANGRDRPAVAGDHR